MKHLLLLALAVGSLMFTACGEEKKEKEPESLVEVKDGIYTEYYPGRKAIKYRGPQDENELRDGRWFFYAENGTELSMTEYSHGKKNGASWVRYPNGMMRYFGEYQDNVQVGEWVTYDEKGNVAATKDFGRPDQPAEAPAN